MRATEDFRRKDVFSHEQCEWQSSAEYVRKSLSARINSCMAGDSFSPHGVWDQILADMGKK